MPRGVLFRPENFFDDVDKTPTCWLWTGTRTARGRYGGINGRGAHRVAYELFVGAIPAGLFVCHRCDNGLCVNPQHLFLGTCKDNVADMIQKGRKAPATSQRGALNHNVKIDEDTVRKIRALRSAGAFLRDICRQTGLGMASVSDICSRKSWSHVV